MRTFPAECAVSLGKFANSEEAWFRRIQSGQGGETMFNDRVKELGGAPYPLFRRLDRPHRQGRAAAREAAAAAGRRAQHRRHHLGLARRQALSARPDRLRSAFPDCECLWPGVRLHRAKASTSFRSSIRRRTPRRTSQRPCAIRIRLDRVMRRGKTDAAVALLGQRAGLEKQGEQSQRHVRS